MRTKVNKKAAFNEYSHQQNPLKWINRHERQQDKAPNKYKKGHLDKAEIP
jgi:hypothetical protein